MAELTTAAQRIEGWFEHPLGFKFQVKTASSPAYRLASADIYAKHRDLPMGEVLLREHRAFQEALITHLLADWKEIEIDGKPVPFSTEKAIEILTDLKYESLYDFIDSKTVELSRGKEKFEKESEKN